MYANIFEASTFEEAFKNWYKLLEQQAPHTQEECTNEEEEDKD